MPLAARSAALAWATVRAAARLRDTPGPILALGLLLVAGCASTPDAPRPATPGRSVDGAPGARGAPLLLGQEIRRIAETLIGTPYRYGGENPASGFDCSGLVHFAHARMGLGVPRTAAAQHAAATPVPRAALAPGDLVFFRTGRREVDHVGIYAGGGRFVHAPRTGRVVSFAYLEDPWFARRFVGAGRFWSKSAPRAVASSGP